MHVSVLHPNLLISNKRRTPEHSLDEAVSLANALDIEILHQAVIPLKKPNAGTLFGSGKLDELAQVFKNHEIDLVIIDGPLTPIQQRNLEKQWNLKVLDRTGLILEIFGDRAQTREGVLQVDLAALNYQRSRLVRSWTHLERQRGGLSFVGGAGETQIESDRRQIDDAILRLKKQLQKVVKTRELHRSARKKVPFPIVALVGYTNAGKSTLFNYMTGAKVFAKDMLFATLDPTMREVELPSGQKIILSDTVGFISELPTQLIAAFRATLEEVLDANLILHVRDISHPETDAQANDVNDILEDLEISDDAKNDIIEVWNKTDLLSNDDLNNAKNISNRADRIRTVSALTGDGLNDLLFQIDQNLKEITISEIVKLAITEGGRRAWLYKNNLVKNEKSNEHFFELSVTWTPKQAAQFLKV
ncbi:GTPase HflX [Amylibacter sp.]|nr:GTPase HflX [Amylibacter sp.]MDB4179087.1 GTPase HflX [Amylibacter sp.]MDB9816904.1 GTPase HflX [Amylibacter sp.]